jgi:hypothetical protein
LERGELLPLFGCFLETKSGDKAPRSKDSVNLRTALILHYEMRLHLGIYAAPITFFSLPSIRMDALHLEFTLQLLAVRQGGLSKHNPIAAHCEFNRCLIASRLYFPGDAYNRKHPWMRHVSLQIDARAGYRLTGGVRQTESDCRGTYPGRLRRNIIPHHQVRRRFGVFPAPNQESAGAGAQRQRHTR